MESMVAIVSFLFLLIPLNTEAMSEGDHEDASCACYIKILGSTNLNSFELEYSFGTHPVSFHLAPDGSTTGSGRLNLPVKEFRGKSEGMEKDFYALVKSDLYPSIVIEFYEITDSGRDTKSNMVKAGITMAGITRVYDILCEVERNPEGGLCLRGDKTIMISDFKLDPPVKFFGLVRVQDFINVDFSVNFTEREQADLMISK